MQLKRLRNVSGVDQAIVFKGKHLILGKDEEMDMDLAVANEFLKRCEDLVTEVVEIGGVVEDKEENVIWVANMTGDPDAPESIRVKQLVGKGQWRMADAINPLKEARAITRSMGGGMLETMGKSGLEGLNLFSTTISVPPYQRRRLPAHIGKWFLQRSAMGTPGACIKSREKSNFEPDMKWQLDDMRVYLQLVDPTAEALDLGPTEKRLKSEASRLKGKNFDEEYRRKIRAAKEMLMKRLHKRLADPRYRLPSKEEFDEYKATFAEGEEGGAVGAGVNPPSTAAEGSQPTA